MTDSTITKPVTIEVPQGVYDDAKERAERTSATVHEVLLDHVDFDIEWVLSG